MTAASPGRPVELMVGRLRDLGLTLASAESLTAGGFAALVASVPGASAVLRGGLVVYATDLKHNLAGVPAEVLRDHGAVSAQTARELAVGAARACGADIGVGLTGVAGPDAQEGHAPGLVYLAVAGVGVPAEVRELELHGDRDRVRARACECAVQAVLGYVDR